MRKKTIAVRSSEKNIYIKKSRIPNAGRGVYAIRNIKKNEVIEKCPVIEIPQHDSSNTNESFLTTYFYYCGKQKERVLIALGFGSIYNHTYTPNALYKIKPAENTIDFIALRDIKKGDEITVNYNGKNPKPTNPLWFE